MRDDVFLTEDRLVHEVTLPVLGIPTRLRSDAPEVVAAFEEALGLWRIVEGRPELLSSERVEGRVVVHAGDEGGHAHAPVRHRVIEPRRLLLSTPGSVFTSDAHRREFTGWVTRELLEDRDHFRYNVLESLVFSIVTWLDRQPVHASAVVRDGTALLLSGSSGTGKSTLTYAAARAGLDVLTDDIVFAQTRPLRVWGMPNFLHVPAEAREHFPELGERPTRLMANGKEKIALRLADLGAAAAFPVAERTGICVLERGPGGPVRCEPLTAAGLEEALLAQMDRGFHLFRDTVGDFVHAVAARGGWRLVTGGHPRDAVPVIEELLTEVERRAADALETPEGAGEVEALEDLR